MLHSYVILIAVCNCVRCAVCGTLIHGVCTVCAAVCGSVRLCGSAAVYGSAHGCLRQCTRMCAAVHLPVCGSARGSVWQCFQQCAAVRQCAAVCGSGAVCGCLAVQRCAAVRRSACFQINSKCIRINSYEFGIILNKIK
jgi:hypothetical protein